MENLKKSLFLLAYFFFASDLALNAHELRGHKDYTGIFLGNFNRFITYFLISNPCVYTYI